MDARTSIKGRLPNRQLTADGSVDAALRLRVGAGEYATGFDAAEIFKKTPGVADLKPRGRYVAKDMREIAGIPLLAGRMFAENLKSAKRNPHQDLARSADSPIAVATGRPIALLWRGEIDTDIGALNVKLTDPELVERKTKWRPGATHHTSGALGRYAQQTGPAVDGAVTHPGGAHEKQCYADI